MKKFEYSLIVSIVNSGASDFVIQSAKESGAKGATTFSAKGSSELCEKLFGTLIKPEKEVVLILVTKKDANSIMKSIGECVNLDGLGKGICFSLPVENVVGTSHLIETLKK